MAKAILRLISSLAMLAAVIIWFRSADRLVERIKGEDKDEDIIDI